MKKVYFKTFGCRTNLFDTQVMVSSMKNFELTDKESEADIVIVNSCTVTNSADSSVRSYINTLKDDARVYLTGCGAHTKGEQLFNDNKVFGVFGQSEKAKIDSILENEQRLYEIGDLEFIDDNIVESFAGKSRAFIKIQEGCDFRCSYCIIPFVRGDSRSIDEKLILEQISKLAVNGFGEIVLTGTNVGSYGKKQGTSIAKLMKKISQIRGVRRIRVGSIEPVQFDDEFKELLDEPWLEKHLHIALQHTSPTMLKIMNRRNKFSEDIKLFEHLNSKGFALGTDFIVGHPGESDEIWKEAMINAKNIPLTHLHAFTYSPRDGTESAKLKNNINGKVAKARLKELNSLVEQKNLDFRNSHKVELEVLLEDEHNGIFKGYDQFFNKVEIKSSEDLKGNWINIDKYDILGTHNYAKV